MTAVPEKPLAEAQRIGQLQASVSASRLNLFLSCRLKFYFRYVLRIPKAKTPALHVGSAVHSVLKAWNKARWKQAPLSLKQLHDEYVNAWTEPGEESSSSIPVQWEPGEEEEEQKVGWRLVETYIRESKIPPNLKPDAVEVPVEADLHHHGLPTLIGVLDLVQEGVITDYKTSGTTPNAEKSMHLNEVQTSAYAVLYRESTGRTEAGIEIHTLVKLKTPKLVVSASPPMTEQQEAKLFKIMESYLHGLDVRDFIPSPGMQCASCQFYNECRQWS